MLIALASHLAASAAKWQDLKAQFQELDLKEPSAWPLMPKALLCLMLACLCVSAVWYAYLSGLRAEFENEKKTEIRLRAEFEKKLSQAISLDGLKQQRAQVQHQVQQVEKQLPNKSEMAALLSEINQAGLGRSLHFELFKPGAEVLKTHYAELPIAVRVSGRFHDIGMFASDIAHFPRIVTLHQLALQPKGTDGLLSLEAVVTTYRYLDTGEVSALRQSQGAAP